jgi:hypothetical protein
MGELESRGGLSVKSLVQSVRHQLVLLPLETGHAIEVPCQPAGIRPAFLFCFLIPSHPLAILAIVCGI